MNIGQWWTDNGMILRPPYTRQHVASNLVAGNKLLSDKLPYTRQLVAGNKLPRITIDIISILLHRKLLCCQCSATSCQE